MNENESTVEQYQLDTLTRTTRFLAGVAPRAMTRVGLGVVLAVDDASNDPAAELMAAKVSQATGAIVSSVGTVGQVVGAKAVSVGSSMKSALRAGVDRMSTSSSAIGKVPALNAAREFVGQAVSEVRSTWDEAGYVVVEVVAEEAAAEPVEDPVLPVIEPESNS